MNRITLALVLTTPVVAQTPTMLSDLNTSARLDSAPSRFFENPSGDTWFTAYPTNATAPALYLSRGTGATTAPIASLSPFVVPQFAFGDNWKGYFVNHTAAHGYELWESNGTAAGTRMVSDLNPGPASSLPKALTICGGDLYHSAYTPATGYELCHLGRILKDIRPGPAGSYPTQLVRAGNFVVFAADDGVRGRELWAFNWRDDKNPFYNKPYPIRDIHPGPKGSDPMSIIPFRNVVYFTADDGTNGRELWRTDGSGSGTRMIKDVHPGAGDGIPDGRLINAHLSLFFVGDTPGAGREPWRSNGDGFGTVMIGDIRPGPLGSDPRELTPLHYERIAFSADDGTNGRELWWATTALGSQKLVDLVPGPTGSDPRDLFYSSDDLYFAATERTTGTEPWTAESIEVRNPRRIADIHPGVGSSRPPGGYAFGIAHKSLIFRADDGTHGTEPWVMDAGAISRPFGQGCGGEFRFPRLRATAPHVGGRVLFTGVGLQTTPSVAVILGSARPLFPLPIARCELQLDLASLITLTTQAASNTYNFVLPIPNDAAFKGAVLRIGATVLPSSDPLLGLDIMNIVDLRVGL